MRVPLIISYVSGGLLIFISTLFMFTGTEFPFFEQEQEPEVEFSFYGVSGNLSYSNLNNDQGWAVYVYGTYLDDDEDGFWDDCPSVQVFPTNGTEQTNQNNSYYELCEIGHGREDVEGMIYVGQICHNPADTSSPNCVDGNYSIEADSLVRLSEESTQSNGDSFLTKIVDSFLTGLRTGRTIFCGGVALLFAGAVLGLLLGEETGISVTKGAGTKAEWRAYALTQTERGDDGLPKAFSRHKSTRDLFTKPKKGNVRGGVHKSGGLHLSGWTSEDSNKAYKKKVQDRRDR
jgi:hypothetical protein